MMACTIQTRVCRAVEMFPDGLDWITWMSIWINYLHTNVCNYAYGGIWTNAKAPLVISAGPHSSFMRVVSCLIQDATKGSTQSSSC